MNPLVKILSRETLYKGWSELTRYVLQYTRKDGTTEQQIREIYNSGDGAAVLLYNNSKKTVMLVRQFRLPAYLNGHPDGMLLEVCAGMLDEKDPETTIIREVYEETGIKISQVTKIFEAFATPGAHMEKIHFFTAPYQDHQKHHDGGGLSEESEEIELYELHYDQIDTQIREGKIVDIKTIALLQYGLLHRILH